MRNQFTIFLAIALCLAVASSALATTFSWSNASGGTYSNAANWTPAGGPPAAGDIAQLTLANTYAINFTTSPTINTFTQTQGDVTLNLNNTTFTTTNSLNNTMGSAGLTSTLRVFDGNFRPGNLYIASVAGSTSNLYLGAEAIARTTAGPLYVGYSGTGNLFLQSGATFLSSAGAGLGINTDAIGNATVTGQDSDWTINFTPLVVGSFGTGTLNILDGGNVTAASLEVGEELASTGTINMSGNLATFSTTGTANIGGNTAAEPATSATLNIGTGATMTLGGTTNLRTNSTVNITGGTLNLNTINITSGSQINWSEGTVNFATAPTITTAVLDAFLDGTHTLGANRTLSATAGQLPITTPLDLTGGKISVPSLVLYSNMDLGAFSTVTTTGQITIQSGATVQIRDFATVGAGTAIVNNGGTILLDGPLAAITGGTTNFLGTITGTGRFSGGLNNSAGATIRAQNGDHIIIDTIGRTNAGMIELSDGTIEYTKSLTNLAGGVISGRGVFRGSSSAPGGNGLINQGVLAYSAGISDIYGDVDNTITGKIVAAGASTVTFFDDVVNNGDIRTVTGSRSVFFGSVTGAGTFTGGGIVELEGDLKPGNSPANVTFGGSLQININAGLGIELGGTIKGAEYDSLTIAGVASLSGTLTTSLINGFVPAVGQSFEILTAAGGVDGTFDSVNLPALAGGLYLNLAYAPTAVTISVAGLLGDFNHNGTVDSADFVLWRKTLGQAGSALAADANNSGTIDQGDYNIWRANFGQNAVIGSGSSVPPSAVPEPSSIMLLAAALSLIPRRSRLSAPAMASASRQSRRNETVESVPTATTPQSACISPSCSPSPCAD